MLFVTVGTGIGVGMVLNGQLYRGVDDAHPEIGHQVIDASGPAVLLWRARLLGGTGCWSGDGARSMSRHRGAGKASAQNRFARWQRPETRSRNEAVEREAHYLGLGLANLVNIFCPEVIVMGGSVMRSALAVHGRHPRGDPAQSAPRFPRSAPRSA